MDQTRSQDQQQKDFLAFLFPDPSADHNRPQDAPQNDVLANAPLATHRVSNNMNNFTGSSNASFNQQPLDLMAMSNLISLQGLDSSLSSPAPAAVTPQMLLEQQYKLTQLHQLQQLQNQIQHQIFQQQLALISGHTPLANHETNPDPPREQFPTFNGLPTPLSSTEIRPTNPDFMTCMNPPFHNSQQTMFNSHGLDSMPLPSLQEPSGSSHFMRHAGSVSAPANIAFPPFVGLPSPSDLDISPLTSPWLEAYPHPPQSRPAKRTTSPSEEDNARVIRKRPTPSPATSMKVLRNVKSATSTPLLRSSMRGGRRNSTVLETDSPSPVDLSMPPPAPPGNTASPPFSVSNVSPVAVPQDETRITPVTPASIMNLGRLGVSSSLAPSAQLPRLDRGKDPGKVKEIISASKGPRKAGPPLIPGPKPILPAGSANSLNSGSSAVSPAAPITRKSHKDAEQKRRDSLKTAYDDLRLLLPPIPLPSDENFPDEPILPGALPPRGPPKAGGDGPNKGISKLQLLRCGNDYIRTLKGRVDRRDTEITTLRQEVLRLRAFAGEEAHKGDGEYVDLEHDLDAVEAGNPKLGQSIMEEEGEDGEE